MSTILKQIEFTPQDHAQAKVIASQLGWGEDYSYTSTSVLIGCFRNSKYGRGHIIIKTEELGFLVVSDLEDLKITI